MPTVCAAERSGLKLCEASHLVGMTHMIQLIAGGLVYGDKGCFFFFPQPPRAARTQLQT